MLLVVVNCPEPAVSLVRFVDIVRLDLYRLLGFFQSRMTTAKCCRFTATLVGKFHLFSNFNCSLMINRIYENLQRLWELMKIICKIAD